MLITRKSIFAVLIALFVLSGFGIASADQIGGLMNNVGAGVTLPPTLNNYVNPAGLGDTLIYNYYNARNNYVTFFTVVNTDSVNGVRARVRIREAADIKPNGLCGNDPRGSFELLDFDICLSKNDMWFGYIMPNPSGDGAVVCSDDTDTEVWDGLNAYSHFPSNCVALKFGGNNTEPNVSAEDTFEGYIEIIGERQISGTPSTCDPANDPGAHADVPNVLFGNAALISMAPTGETFTYDATAIADFALGDIWDSPTTSLPTLASGIDGIPGVNFILAKWMLYSIYDLVGSQTEFIVTLPTKQLSQACGGNNDIFDDNRVTFQFFDDAEHPTTGGGCAFSPCPPEQEDHLPYEVNAILPATGNSIMDSQVEVLPLITTPYSFGWFSLNLNRAALAPAHENPFPVGAPAAISYGWPSLGLTLLDVDGGTSTGAFSMQNVTDVH